jgi:glycine cleavage system H lipoate-binding protein
MQAATEFLQVIGIFLSGLLVRDGLFIVALAALVAPALAIALVLHGIAQRREKALGLRRVAGLSFRPDVHYAPNHTWLCRRPGGATLELGVDALAQRLMPSVSAVELPRPGAAFERGETIAVLHAGGWAVPIAAPVAGTVSGVNAAVLSDPGMVKRENYGRGWLVAFKPADPSFAELPQGDAGEGWLKRESARWDRFFEEQLGFAAADGGQLVAPAPSLLGEAGYKALTKAFLALPSRGPTAI